MLSPNIQVFVLEYRIGRYKNFLLPFLMPIFMPLNVYKSDVEVYVTFRQNIQGIHFFLNMTRGRTFQLR